MNDMKVGFEMRKINLALEVLMPVRKIKDHHSLKRYDAIVKSIRAVGLIEPLMVYPQKDRPNTYLLVDGHLRLLALKQIGKKTAECIVAKDDECFTYNNRISRLPPIQCHKMIVKTVRNGVRPERIAEALDMELKTVKGLISLLDGIDEMAADMLRDKNVSPKAIQLLKKVKGLRQIEIAEFMVDTNNFTKGYAEALVMGTQKDQLVHPDTPKVKAGLSPEDVARLEQEMESLEKDFKSVEAAYTENMMNLTLARTYVKNLLKNPKIVRFLRANYSDFLPEFERITATEAV
jgi:hypothetical protein